MEMCMQAQPCGCTSLSAIFSAWNFLCARVVHSSFCLNSVPVAVFGTLRIITQPCICMASTFFFHSSDSTVNWSNTTLVCGCISAQYSFFFASKGRSLYTLLSLQNVCLWASGCALAVEAYCDSEVTVFSGWNPALCSTSFASPISFLDPVLPAQDHKWVLLGLTSWLHLY